MLSPHRHNSCQKLLEPKEISKPVPCCEKTEFMTVRPTTKQRRQVLLRYPQYEDRNRIRFEGWANIKTSIGTTTPVFTRKPETWDVKYCVLERTCFVHYELVLEQMFTLSSSFTIQHQHDCASSVTHLQKNILGYEFSVMDGDNTSVFAALSFAEFESWMNAFESLFNGITKSHRGTLFFHTTAQKWKTYEVILDVNGVLQIFSKEQRKIFSLKEAVMETNSDERVISLHRGGEIIQLYLRFDENYKDWVNELDLEISITNHLEDGQGDSIYNTPEYITLKNDIFEIIIRGKEEDEKRIQRKKERQSPLYKTLSSSSTDVNKKKPYFIISLDGGGLRGIITIVLLERIQRYFYDILDRMIFIAGTSTGSIISSGIALGHSPSVMRTLFEAKGPLIFSQPCSTFSSISQNKYDNFWLTSICGETIGNTKFADLEKSMMISAFALDNDVPGDHSWEPRLFHNLGDSKENQMPVFDAVKYSTAAPTYFPSIDKHIDGAVFDQNPSSSALTLALSPKGGNIPLEDIVLLSIGTGKVKRFIGEETPWGVAQWLPKLTNLLWDGMVMKSELICKQLLGDRYHRCDAILEEEIAMDEAATIPQMEEIANAVNLSQTLNWIAANVYGISEQGKQE